MFLKLFDQLFSALNKNVKLTLLAALLTALISWGISAEYRVIEAKDDCADDRKEDKATIVAKDEELKDIRIRLFDAFMAQRTQREITHQNDSLIRQATNNAINKIQP